MTSTTTDRDPLPARQGQAMKTPEVIVMEIIGECHCDPGFKSRGRADPICVFCNHARDLVDAISDARRDALEQAAKVAASESRCDPWSAHVAGNPVANHLGTPGQCVEVARELIASAIRALIGKDSQ